MKRTLVAAAIGAMLLQPGAVRLGADSATLNHFKNYFLTGDYVVGGASLWRQGASGRAKAHIDISGVPAGADVVAAFLYVQTAEVVRWSGIDQATFNGVGFGPGTESLARALNWEQATRPCWSIGWGADRRLVTYRADVLRMLPIGEDGKTSANGTHQLEVPDDGALFPDGDEGDVEWWRHPGPRAVGASLVVVYRDSAKPLRGIVIRDGAATKSAFGTLTMPIPGFYQAAAQPNARLTALVGDGRKFLSERVYFNGLLVATNPFVSSSGAKWDNPTFTNLPLGGGASSAVLQIAPQGLLSDCVSVSAVVMSTDVQDTDGDGLLDVWESSTAPILDPLGQPLPNLRAMGADPGQKDLFVEVNYMYAGTPLSYGGVAKPAHSHLPTHAALKLVGDAFANAPTGRINVHFDVGNSYPPGEADPYIIRGAGLARGGEAIDETATVCTRGPGDPPDVCQFSAHPGTVGWKTGFQFLRDAVLSGPPPLPSGDDPCDLPGASCVRRFDRNRKDTFRFALFTHAIGLPKSDVAGHPDFNVPRTNTGVGDFPGGDFIVSLGAFDDESGLPVGTSFMQGSTILHELGHGLERRHGGDAFEPNCKPLYLSAMNYLYQLRGLLDDSGRPHLDFSREDFSGIAIDETALFDGSLSLLPYRIGYYAPLATSYMATIGTPVARHCDGSLILPSDPSMVRIDARTSAGAVDWNANGSTESALFSQDVNFNGRSANPDSSPEVLAGGNDWAKIALNQVGARRSAGGLFVDTMGRFAVGPLSLDAGRGDLGRGDLGRGDLGRGDLGRGDLGRGDLGRGDLGRGDLGTILGRGDLGRGDLGGGDLFVGGPGEPGGELDFETAVGLAKTPPNELRACVIGAGCAEGETPLHKVRLDWTASNVGAITQYQAMRVTGSELTPESVAAAVVVGLLTAVPGQADYSLIDTSTLVNGQAYTYFARAIYADGTLSDPSNIVTIVAVNDPPVAVDDSYTTDRDTELSQPAPGVLANDTDADGAGTLQAVLVMGPAHGTLTLNSDGSFVYDPNAGYSGPDSFTYRASDGGTASNVATVAITVVQKDYAFINVKNAPPPPGTTVNPGSTLPMSWAFSDGTTRVASGHIVQTVTVAGPLPGGPVRTYTNTDSGQSSFRYSNSSKSWSFNLQTKDEAGKPFPVGNYAVTITPSTPGFGPSPTFQIRVVK